MNQDNMLIGVVVEESETISYIEICQKYNISKELLIEMMEHGLFTNHSMRLEELALHPQELRRIESAFRLHQDLGINLEGVVLAIELLEKIDKMEHELLILRKHF